VEMTGMTPSIANVLILGRLFHSLPFLIDCYEEATEEDQNAPGDQAGSQLFVEQDSGKNDPEDWKQVNGKGGAHDLHRLDHREIQQHGNAEAEDRDENQAPPDVRLKMGKLTPTRRLHDFAKYGQFHIGNHKGPHKHLSRREPRKRTAAVG